MQVCDYSTWFHVPSCVRQLPTAACITGSAFQFPCRMSSRTHRPHCEICLPDCGYKHFSFRSRPISACFFVLFRISIQICTFSYLLRVFILAAGHVELPVPERSVPAYAPRGARTRPDLSAVQPVRRLLHCALSDALSDGECVQLWRRDTAAAIGRSRAAAAAPLLAAGASHCERAALLCAQRRAPEPIPGAPATHCPPQSQRLLPNR